MFARKTRGPRGEPTKRTVAFLTLRGGIDDALTRSLDDKSGPFRSAYGRGNMTFAANSLRLRPGLAESRPSTFDRATNYGEAMPGNRQPSKQPCARRHPRSDIQRPADALACYAGVRAASLLSLTLLLNACSAPSPDVPSLASAAYFDTTGRVDIDAGGVRMIPITTPKGDFRVWTKRVGNNPTIKVLLLHGGPGMTHEYWEAADSYFPAASVEYYYYDQLGSTRSDQPKDQDLWETGRFVEEVEQVRAALGLDSTNFFLMGHSWGGILAMEYALKYQQHLKGLVISNMMASIPAYNAYADNTLMPAMDPAVLAEVKAIEARKDYANPRYMELLIPAHYETHFLRRPFAEWPEPVARTMAHVNTDVYIPMQGPSELGASGKLLNWDRVADLPKIAVPTLVIGGTHDTMDPAHMEMMARTVQRGRYLLCPNSGHMAMYDDQAIYFGGVINFLQDVDRKVFP